MGGPRQFFVLSVKSVNPWLKRATCGAGGVAVYHIGMSHRQRILLARAIAIAADAVQASLFMFTAEGAISPVNDAIDVIACVVIVRLLGWHIAFLPSFVVKMLPMVDLAPTWTIAVLIVTRKGAADQAQPAIDHPRGGASEVR
jgi:hypothetical protein